MNVIEVEAPASKSMSHRALIAAAMSPGESSLSNVLDSRDITRTRACLEALGASITSKEQDVLRVQGISQEKKGGDQSLVELDMEESGTTCRLMTAVACAHKGKYLVYGSGRLHDRPIGQLASALRSLGVEFDWQEKEGYPPFIMTSDGLEPGEINISLEESSQYLSGLLLACAMAKGPVAINVTGKKAVSWPYVALTLKIMEDYKAKVAVQTVVDGEWKEVPWRTVKKVEPGNIRFRVEPSGYERTNYRVESDWSNGSYFLCAGAIGPNAVKVKGLSIDSLQGDRAILDILCQMGGRTNWGTDSVTMYPSVLKGMELDMGKCPDIVPTVAVAASFAHGSTRIKNVAHLHIKECDRLAALDAEVSKTGCETVLYEDGIKIIPKPVKEGETIEFCSYDDHRLAMSMALYGLKGIDAKIDNPDCVAKSFPGYWDEFAKLKQGV